MEIEGVVERVQRVAAVRADGAAGRADIEAALCATTALKSWLASSQAALAARLAAFDSFPEKTVGDCTRGSTRDGAKIKERADTLDKSPAMADALDDGDVTEGHVDALTNTAKGLDDDDQRAELFDRVEGLVDVAAAANLAEWRRRLALEAKHIQRNDGIDKLQRQRRATRLRSWVDGDGMVCLSGRFDPVTGRTILARLDHTVEALFAEAVPDTCPSDPIDKQRHLQALALARLADPDTTVAPTRPGRPEYVVVIDTSSSDGAGGPTVDWGIPIEIPHRVLADMIGDGDVHTVVVRNGVVLHAPGQLNLGRTTRLANRAQRRALRALYATCAIPGCSVGFDRCKLHHIVWWRHGGRTDLENLLPVCAHHHTKIHNENWIIELGPNRELTIRFPDGTVHNTGPPTRQAA